jgi:cytochrome c oxidase subunit 2
MFNEAFAGSIPLAGTEVAARWDHLYGFLIGLSVFFFVLVCGAMLYFVVAYRHRPGEKTKYIVGNHLLEAIWIALPTLLLMIIFGWGYSVYHNMTQAPTDAYEIRVIGKQWLWTFQYDNGRTTVGEVFVPINRPVKLIMTSEDVLHGFFVPNFRVKQDVVPGMYTSIWFTATVPGKHQVFCTEYCGTSHSEMLAKVVVLDDEQWNQWNRNKKLGVIPEAGKDVAFSDQIQTSSASPEKVTLTPLAHQGKKVYEMKGCVACHTVDGTTKIGPSHKGLYGRKTQLTDGRTVVADDNYIRGHIENPQGTLVKGYSPVMPTFKGLISETEMNALLAYLKTVK